MGRPPADGGQMAMYTLTLGGRVRCIVVAGAPLPVPGLVHAAQPATGAHPLRSQTRETGERSGRPQTAWQ